MKTLVIALAFCASAFAQDSYPKNYFKSPLDIPLQLSGNFGELRTNHFHAGLDFRTQQKEGFNVYAAAEGYVSRIKISSYGYGKAIYVTHPNGFTTLYGHLQKGSPRLEAFINAKQYEEKAYEIEVFLKAEDLPVKQGEIIGISGNTGGSGGPHLHFEVRDSKTEKTINPLHFYSDILLDNKRPIINGLYAYPLDENSTVNQSNVPVAIDLRSLSDGKYVTERVLASGNIGFGINTNDSDNSSSFKNGTYKVETSLNGKPSFWYQFDTFAFDESRYLNALMDYTRYKRTSQKVQKLFMKRPYPLSIINTDKANGIIQVTPNLTQTYRIDLTDFSQNKTSVTVPIEYSPLPATNTSKDKITPFFIKSDKEYNFEKDNVSVFIPANAFYDDFYLDFDVKDSVLSLHNNSVPVHSSIVVTITDSLLSDEDRAKTFIAIANGKSFGYSGTIRKGNSFVTYTKSLGEFKLAKDLIAPKIVSTTNIQGKTVRVGTNIDFTISDNLSGIKEYAGYINGNWVLFEFEHKLRRLRHNLASEHIVDGKNDLKILVSDNVGNSTIFETHFFSSKK